MKIKLLVLAAIGVATALTFARAKDHQVDESPRIYVDDKESKIDMVQIPGSSGMATFVDKNSIIEFPWDGITLRSATFAHRLTEPLEIKGEKVHYVYKEAAFHCDTGNYVETLFIFYGNDADKPLFYSEGDGQVSNAKESKNGLAEFSYVCSYKTPTKKKTPPKSDKPVKTSKSIDI